ncbi:hypothetical protein KW429_11345 [Vibrio fluvialis]|nr:hypothetical protein [Vibrio fluvialis]
MYPEIVKLDIDSQIDGFETMVLGRQLDCFSDIALEAQEKKQAYLDEQSNNFDPEHSDEGIIAENAYFVEIAYTSMWQSLKNDFLNSAAVSIFHMFEKQKKGFFGTDISGDISARLLADGYDINQCPEWNLLNRELRTVANAVKHGPDSGAAKRLKQDFPHRIDREHAFVDEPALRRYIVALRAFWERVLRGKIVLEETNI